MSVPGKWQGWYCNKKAGGQNSTKNLIQSVDAHEDWDTDARNTMNRVDIFLGSNPPCSKYVDMSHEQGG